MLDFLGLAPTAQVTLKQMLQKPPRSFRMSLEHINVVAKGGPVKRIIWAPISGRVPRPCLCALCRDRACPERSRRGGAFDFDEESYGRAVSPSA
jgi:hypothetical protein